MHRYQTVYRDLLGQITSGSLVPGTVLPTELQLAKAFGVSRPTIRHALQMLESEGLVDRRKHRGTMVLESKIEQGWASSKLPFTPQTATFLPFCVCIWSCWILETPLSG